MPSISSWFWVLLGNSATFHSPTSWMAVLYLFSSKLQPPPLLSLLAVNRFLFTWGTRSREFLCAPTTMSYHLPACVPMYSSSMLLLGMNCPSSPILPFVDWIPFLVLHHLRILPLYLLHHHFPPCVLDDLYQHILFCKFSHLKNFHSTLCALEPLAISLFPFTAKFLKSYVCTFYFQFPSSHFFQNQG